MDDKLTIVGPEPSGKGRSAPSRVNIEALLLMAKYNDEFRQLLLSDRARAIEECGMSFSDAERLLLKSVPRDKLEASIESFSMEGVTRETLPSWKEAAAIVLLVMTVLMGGACLSTGDREPALCDDPRNVNIDDARSGWCGEDIYRLTAYGAPQKKTIDINKRKEEARKMAEIMARYQILEKFIGSRIEAGGIMADDYYEKQQKKDREQLLNVVREGRVVAHKWDNEQNCAVLYEIKKQGLRKFVMSDMTP